jgi:hypothetical protein
MIRNTLFAAAIALGSSTAAFAQSGPVLSGGGDDMSLRYADGASAVPTGNIVGGGDVRVSGGGDDRMAVNARPIFGEAGPVAMILGGGDNGVILYRPGSAAAATTLAGASTGRGGARN